MDARAALLELIAPLAIGDEVVPGARLARVSDDLGPRLVVDAQPGQELQRIAQIACALCTHLTRQ